MFWEKKRWLIDNFETSMFNLKLLLQITDFDSQIEIRIVTRAFPQDKFELTIQFYYFNF